MVIRLQKYLVSFEILKLNRMKYATYLLLIMTVASKASSDSNGDAAIDDKATAAKIEEVTDLASPKTPGDAKVTETNDASTDSSGSKKDSSNSKKDSSNSKADSSDSKTGSSDSKSGDSSEGSDSGKNGKGQKSHSGKNNKG